MENASTHKTRQALQQSLPIWYSWSLHIKLNSVLILSGLIFPFFWIHITFESFLLMIPFFIFWSLFEYAIHGIIIHKYFIRIKTLREIHLCHHSYFTNKDMFLSDPIDVARIFLWPRDILVIFAINFCISVVIGALISPNFAGILFFTGTLYLLSYEIVHCLSHLTAVPKFLATTRKHHRDHHDRNEMNNKNFAVVFPFIDTVFKTKQRGKS